jgi:hypothetical protein
MEVIIAALVTALGLSTILLYKKNGEVQLRLAETENRLNSANEQIDTMQRRFKPVIDIELEADKIRAEKVQLEDAIAQTRSTYREKRALLDKLVREAAIYDEEIKLAELGFYKPHFDFDASEIYKNRITKNREQQKELVNDKTAIQALTEWTLEGSRAKGRTMMNRAIRLTARAFNNECSTAVANVRWNNVQRMEARIIKAFEAINKLNESSEIVISRDYLNLKIEEIHLTYEYHRKRQDEKEEQAEARRLLREEAKLQKEAEKAASEEEKYQRLLDQARRQAEGASASQMEALQRKLDTLNKQLAEAHEKSERAKSMAEQTRAGYIYVISNIGSFGSDVYKIGMTRRLEPSERVKELGDASVPFAFDTHAMIYTKDAPSLEKALHNAFEEHRVNMVNARKEFFRVSLQDICSEVRKTFPEATFLDTAEAQEYNETIAMAEVAKQSASTESEIVAQFPDEI